MLVFSLDALLGPQYDSMLVSFFKTLTKGSRIDGSELMAKLTGFFAIEDIFIYLFPKEIWQKIIIILNTVSKDDSCRVLL